MKFAEGYTNTSIHLVRHIYAHDSIHNALGITLYVSVCIVGAPNSLKVVIIGGSHSGFSAAWMMLNRLQQQLDLCSVDSPVPICRTNRYDR